jgi:hypothetical protein
LAPVIGRIGDHFGGLDAGWLGHKSGSSLRPRYRDFQVPRGSPFN